jgi:hypothetical protein
MDGDMNLDNFKKMNIGDMEFVKDIDAKTPAVMAIRIPGGFLYSSIGGLVFVNENFEKESVINEE